jgi:DNA ligase 1
MAPKMTLLISKPMLAETLPPDAKPTFPVEATPKIDGIRAIRVGGKLVSRTLKPIPNDLIREQLGAALPDGADGEILYGDSFQRCTSMVMSADKVPSSGTHVTYYMFDLVLSDPNKPYVERMNDMRALFASREAPKPADKRVRVIPLYPKTISTQAELDAFESRALAEGFEGVMIRRGDGRYKFGRSTLREALLLKIKRFSDAEALVIGCEELLHNENEATVDHLGYSKRSSHRENKTQSGMLGALVVENADGVRFRIGTGFSHEERTDLWKRRASLKGQLAKFKYLEVGVKSAPRHPVFLGFRSPDDV